MIHRATWVWIVLGGCWLASGATQAVSSPLSGTWNVTVTQLGVSQDRRLRITQDGSHIHGSLGRQEFSGMMQGDHLHLTCDSQPSCGDIRLCLSDSSIDGDGTLDSIPVTLHGKREAILPSSHPRTFDYAPQTFSGQFGAAEKPVLSIFPGDSVRTWTLDAEGFDAQGVRRIALVNPQTGPFYIETAMPGDTLAVHFTRMRTNRSTADMYGDTLVPQALDPRSLRGEAAHPWAPGPWKLDAMRGVATPMRPTRKLGQFEIPIQPMLGCVAVAPPYGQSLRTVNLGAFGGNLDYSGIHEGSTVYLPVFQAGALLFVGDGHARQGDGELTGTGLEISMDVEFTVDLIKDKSLGQPRIEDAEFIMFSGIGGSLSDALQMATSGMTRWLRDTYDLDAGDIAMIVGSSMRYDIAEIVDPQIHIVAKLPRTLLSTISVAYPPPSNTP